MCVLVSTRKKEKAADENSDGQDGSLASQSEDYEEDSWLVDDEDDGANNEVGTLQASDGKVSGNMGLTGRRGHSGALRG